MAVNVRLIRWAVQHLSFIVLMYGGRFGVHLGSALPCFSCPYVGGCGGYCYLMGLQGYIGVGISLVSVFDIRLFKALGWLAVFVGLVALLGKSWCGWVCPFGLISDWLTSLRKKFGIRERKISTENHKKLSLIKYILLFYLLSIPPLISLGFLHEDFYLPFCNICPAKSLLPLFSGNTQNMALNLSNGISFSFSFALLIITGVSLVGMFYKERFFCLFCPMLALIHILKPFHILRLHKNQSACIGCGNCRRVCPMDIETVYKERLSSDVQAGECLACANCVSSCPTDTSLSLKFHKFNIFSSSRKNVAGIRGRI